MMNGYNFRLLLCLLLHKSKKAEVNVWHSETLETFAKITNEEFGLNLLSLSFSSNVIFQIVSKAFLLMYIITNDFYQLSSQCKNVSFPFFSVFIRRAMLRFYHVPKTSLVCLFGIGKIINFHVPLASVLFLLLLT